RGRELIGAQADGPGEVARRVGPEPHECARRGEHRGRERRVSPAHVEIGRRRGGLAPRFAGFDHCAETVTALDAATTPRRHWSAAWRAVAAVAGSAAPSPI